jgi:cell division protein FtsN
MRGRHGGGGLGTAFFLLGCLVVLGVTFGAGVLAGRYWAIPARAAAVATDERPAPARGRALAPAATPTPPAAAPTPSFYQELTAPLGATGPARPASARTVERAAPAAGPAAPERGAAPGRDGEPPAVARTQAEPPPDGAAALPARVAAPRAGETRFTVQVGAYRSRAQADALRERLAAAGHDAYVAETEGGGEVRYRVRVGAYASREAARAAAVRLASEATLPTYVTTR